MGTAQRLACTAVLAAALLAAASPRPAIAGHPFGTEDAGTLGAGAIEVEFNAERVQRSDGVRVDMPGIVLTVGIAPNLDIAMSGSYDFERAPDGTTDQSPGPFLATLKTALNEGHEWTPTVAVQGGISLPAVEGEQVLVPLTLIAEWEFDTVDLFANVGADIGTRLAGNEDVSSRLRGSLAGSLEIREEWFLLSELLWDQETIPTSSAAIEWLIGARYEITEAVAVDAGIRWGLTTESPHVTYLVGITLGFRGWDPNSGQAAVEPDRL